MGFFINAMLAFAIVALAAGLIHLSTQQMARFSAMKTEFAAAPGARMVNLRPAFTR